MTRDGEGTFSTARISWGKKEIDVRCFFAWYDFWVGAFWSSSSRTLYLCPIPCCVIAISKVERIAL